MTLPTLLCALLAAVDAAPRPLRPPVPTIELRRGLVITKSVHVLRRSYRLSAAESTDSALIVIRGDHIVVDLNGASLLGAEPDADPDRATGVAIRVEGGTDITIKNGAIHGYRFSIIVRDTKDLTLADLDLGESWRPRLYSLVEHESIVDWLSFHHNEKGEWLRYGAAVYLDGVQRGEIRGVRAEHGMNGLMLTRCDSVRLHDNTIQFNSGLGIGLYRSSDNTILHNRLDFNVRGYSNGFYWRGQDSADLLFFEQSSRNLVAYNSATHGGDGFFLWAGQSTMDSGEGGANDNVLFDNDFSFAPANAIEATFSRNRFVANRAEGSDYGLWGGYSFQSQVLNNCFAGDRIGVAIEHGQDNDIQGNHLDRNEIGIRLWGDKLEPSDWGYPKHRATDSREVRIQGNVLSRERVGIRIADTRAVLVRFNSFAAVDTAMVFKDTTGVTVDSNAVEHERGIPTATACSPASVRADLPKLAPAAALPLLEIPSSTLSRRDRAAIIVDEWGPYDWRSPKLWPVDSTHAMPLRLAVLGPAGGWRTISHRGLALVSPIQSRMNDTITVTPYEHSRGDWEVTLEYRPAKGGPSMRFAYSHFEPIQEWRVSAFIWSDSTDPRSRGSDFEALLRSPPMATMHPRRLDYEWYRPALAALPKERWGLAATSTVDLAPGRYTLRAISDDGVRVWVDGRLLIDDWISHESTVDAVPLPAGRHELRVEYYQVDGWTELRVDIVRGTQRAGGSPGPH